MLSINKNNLVFILWGAYAQKKIALIDQGKHLILKAPHPSPFSAHTGFFGCKHFSKANNYLQSTNQQVVNWEI
jgi:uracil-DNA glycosylase